MKLEAGSRHALSRCGADDPGAFTICDHAPTQRQWAAHTDNQLTGGATDSPYAQLKSKAMIVGEFPVLFELAGTVKDSALIVDALREAGDDPAPPSWSRCTG